MRDTLNANVPRDATKSENRETAIGVVRFHDLPHIEKSSLVLIWALTDVMKWTLWRWLAIASRIVDGGHETDLPPWAQIVNESGSSKDFDVIENQYGSTFTTQPLLVVLKLIQAGNECIKYAVLGTYQRELYSLIQIAIAELCQGKNELTQVGIAWVSSWQLMTCDILISTRYLLLDFKAILKIFLTHSKTSASSIVNILKAHVELDCLVWILNGFCSHDKLTSIVAGFIR